ncbi:hypothetical protein [Streptomyces capitiformicae]|uniref:Secreted protein n=1 Tax=Streptomyces capitiformicae TaxID=2014920 RepID=A0A919DRQ9_9ACTN|nr:hypothetical protein [Streptomyces capitiformicae]GHE70388.1 hypothetical protein GCM10017771_94360 [Streptomyces capitiformicae]
MLRFKKVVLVTAIVGSVGLTGTGTAQAADSGDQPDVTARDAQVLECEQAFRSSVVTIAPTVNVLGESITNVGNFCTAAAPRG